MSEKPMRRNGRKLLCLVVLITLTMVAAQCGSQPVEPAATAPPAATEAPATPEANAFDGVQLSFVGWQGYEDPEAMQPLYDATGMKTINATYPSNLEEVMSLYTAGGPGSYDIGVGMNRYIMMMYEMGMLEPLDESKLPNLEQMLPVYQEDDYWGRIDGKLYAVPAFIGWDSICYNADLVSEVPDWNYYKNPAFQGKYGVLNNPLGSLYLWGMTLGKSLDAREWTQEDLADIKAVGMEVFKNALTLVAGEGEEADLLARGDIIVMPNCNEGSAARAREAGVNIQTVVPPGPIKMWADYYFIYKGSKNPDAAHAWINQAISAEAMALMTSKMGYAPPNAKAYELLDPELAEKLGWPGINELLQNAPLSVLPDPNAQAPSVTVEDMYKTFDEVMASIGQ